MLRGFRRTIGKEGIRIIDKIMKPEDKIHILIACFQKSGSTYLARLLREVTGFKRARLCQFYGNNEQDICQFRIQKFRWANVVTQQHIKGTDNNIALMKKHYFKPVVLTRNISDVIMSLHDHIEIEGRRSPTGYVHKEYFEMNKEEKLMYLIRVHLPWYFNFFIAWQEASQTMDVLWTSYEELFSNQCKTVRKILDYYGVLATNNQIENAISAIKTKNTRLNVGKSGRGESLSTAHKEAMLDLAACWKVNKELMKVIGVKL
ncbi:MAG: sulfotransferase domain-containing protein [Planctomycetota bacterium]|jgi:hypothetical protein